jgi:hypothetical protein
MLKINALVKIVDFLSGNELRATSLSAIDECKKCAVRPFVAHHLRVAHVQNSDQGFVPIFPRPCNPS